MKYDASRLLLFQELNAHLSPIVSLFKAFCKTQSCLCRTLSRDKPVGLFLAQILSGPQLCDLFLPLHSDKYYDHILYDFQEAS